VRGEKVMFDQDLTELYGVETRVLVQAVKRNIERFPPGFMFQLSKDEFSDLRSQIVTSNWGGR
jgi:ORF6N domain